MLPIGMYSATSLNRMRLKETETPALYGASSPVDLFSKSALVQCNRFSRSFLVPFNEVTLFTKVQHVTLSLHAQYTKIGSYVPDNAMTITE